MAIYTKRGDTGRTSLLDGERVAKDDIRVEANGQLDELNSLLGIVTASMQPDDVELTRLQTIQRLLMAVMGLIADGRNRPFDYAPIDDMTTALEHFIDEQSGNDRFAFVVPGGSLPAALLHYARAKVRTCERRLWTLRRDYPLDERVMRLMNRLSDYLFTLAVARQS